jgi:type IV pilus assembly protein PilB
VSARFHPYGRLVAYHDGVAKRIGELLVEAGVLSQQQLEQALFAQRKDGRKLGQLLIELGLVGEIQLTQTLSRQLSVPWVSLYHVDFSRSLLNLVPRAVAERYSLVPIFVRRLRNQGETLYVAMDDPTNDAALEEVTRASSLPVKPMIACPSDIRAAIRVYYLGEPAPAAAGDAGGVPEPPPSSLVAAVAPAVPTTSPKEPTSAVQSLERKRSRPDGASPVRPAPPAVGQEVARDVTGEQKEATPLPRMRARMISLTLLDGTTIAVPSPKKRASRPDTEEARSEQPSDQLTARDLVSALRAVAHGADASEILGQEPSWEAMFSVLLSILLRKGLIADWEFVEEFRKI